MQRIDTKLSGHGGVYAYVMAQFNSGKHPDQIASAIRVLTDEPVTGRTLYNWIARWQSSANDSAEAKTEAAA